MMYEVIDDPDYANSVTAVVYHHDPDPWHDYLPSQHETRFNYYEDLLGIITRDIVINGQVGMNYSSGTPDDVRDLVDEIQLTESPYLIDIETLGTGNDITATITVHRNDMPVEGTHRFFLAMETVYTDDYQQQDQTFWKCDMVEMSPGAQGVELAVAENDSMVISESFLWPVTLEFNHQEWNLHESNIRLVAFIQDIDNGEVLQSEWEDLDYYRVDQTAGITTRMIAAGDTVRFPYLIANNGTFEDSIAVLIEDNLPDDWSWTYTTPWGAQGEESGFHLDAGEEFEGELTIITSETGFNSSGFITLNAASTTYGTVQSEMTYSVVIPGRILVVNDDMYIDVNNDTTWQTGDQDYYETALQQINDTVPGEELDYTILATPSRDLDWFDLLDTETELVIWQSGAQGELNGIDQQALCDFLDLGNSMFISGCNWSLAARDNQLGERLGCDYGSRLTAVEPVEGVPGNPLTAGMVFETGGGDGSNTGRYAAALELTTGEQCFTYVDEVEPAGVIHEVADMKTMALGFPFESIDNESSRIALLQNSIAWMTGFGEYSSVDPVEKLPSEPFTASMYPNPFNSTLSIRVTLSQSSVLSLSVYNLSGAVLYSNAKQEYNPGLHRFSWNAASLASGVYLVKINSHRKGRAYAYEQKVILVK